MTNMFYIYNFKKQHITNLQVLERNYKPSKKNNPFLVQATHVH